MELLSCLLLCLESRVAGTYQVANRLVRFVWHPDGRQLAGSMKPRKADRIATICLHPITSTFRHQRRCDNTAFVTQFNDLPVEPITSRAGFVAEVKLGPA